MAIETLDETGNILRALKAETRRLVRRASIAAERAGVDLKYAEGLDFSVSELQRSIASDLSGRVAVIANDALERARRARRKAERWAAAVDGRPVNRITLKALTAPDEGWTALTVDDRHEKTVRLPPALGWIARFLSTAPTGNDGLPVWQSFDAMSKALGLEDGSRSNRRAIVQRIYRLRSLLARAGAPYDTLKVDRRCGVRFVVRRRGV